MNIITLRYFNPVGAYSTSLIGELPNGVPANLAPFITQCAIGKLKEITIHGADYETPDGTPIRDYIHVVDLAKAHVAAMDSIIKKKITRTYEVFNLGTGTGYSVLEVIKVFEKSTEKNLTIILAPEMRRIVNNKMLDLTVFDHLILSRYHYLSFGDEGLL